MKPCRGMTMILFEHLGECVINFDTLVGGRSAHTVRWVQVELGGVNAQYDRHMNIVSLRPRKKKKECYQLSPDGLAWFWIVVKGKKVWDSRDTFPVFATNEEARSHRIEQADKAMKEMYQLTGDEFYNRSIDQ